MGCVLCSEEEEERNRDADTWKQERITNCCSVLFSLPKRLLFSHVNSNEGFICDEQMSGVFPGATSNRWTTRPTPTSPLLSTRTDFMLKPLKKYFHVQESETNCTEDTRKDAVPFQHPQKAIFLSSLQAPQNTAQQVFGKGFHSDLSVDSEPRGQLNFIS